MDVVSFHHNLFPNPCLLLTVMATQFVRTFDKSVFKAFLLQKPRIKPITKDDSDNSKRLIIMNESITDTSLSQLPDALSSWVKDQKDVSVVMHPVVLDYDYFTATEVGVFRRRVMDRC